MIRIKKAVLSTKNYVYRNRGKLVFAACLGAFSALQFRNSRLLNEFLEEKGLLDEYYETDEV